MHSILCLWLGGGGLHKYEHAFCLSINLNTTFKKALQLLSFREVFNGYMLKQKS